MTEVLPTSAPAAADPGMALVRRYAAGRDAAAFAEIVSRYSGLVYWTCYRIVADAARAEDLTQETFFRLLRRPDQITESAAAWLHQVATRLAIDARRTDAARRRREAMYADARAETLDADELAWRDVSPALDEALADLPAGARALLVRHFLEGASQTELAAEQNVSPATLCRRMRAAVDALHDALRRRGVVGGLLGPAVLARLMLRASAGRPPGSLAVKTSKLKLIAGRLRDGRPVADALVRPVAAAKPAAAATAGSWAQDAAAIALLVTVTLLTVTLMLRELGPAGRARLSAFVCHGSTPAQADAR